MIMIFRMVIKILLEMQAFTDPDCISRFIECLHLHLNLDNHIDNHDQNLMIEGFHLK